MKTAAFAENRAWKNLYIAALFEDDKSKILSRVRDAEIEILKRARALLGTTGDNVTEAQALDNALHMLHILRGCLKADEAKAS